MALSQNAKKVCAASTGCCVLAVIVVIIGAIWVLRQISRHGAEAGPDNPLVYDSPGCGIMIEINKGDSCPAEHPRIEGPAGSAESYVFTEGYPWYDEVEISGDLPAVELCKVRNGSQYRNGNRQWGHVRVFDTKANSSIQVYKEGKYKISSSVDMYAYRTMSGGGCEDYSYVEQAGIAGTLAGAFGIFAMAALILLIVVCCIVGGCCCVDVDQSSSANTA